MGNTDNRRIEIRLYQPSSFRSNFTHFRRWDGDAYKAVGDDYKMFIQFWHEFIRKAAYRPRSLRFRSDRHDLIDVKDFAEQFSPKVSDWMTANYEFKETQQH